MNRKEYAKNTYIDQLVEKMENGEKLTAPKRFLVRAYRAKAYERYGFICVDDALHGVENAVALAQQLSMAGINELYITGDWGNQFDAYMAMDDFGLKLRGICRVKNAEYYRDIEKWGDSDRPSDLTALKFSFKEESV